MTTVDPKRCPLCGEPNACAAAAAAAGGGSCGDCWCFHAKVADTALAQIPAAARGVACVCARCAAAPPGSDRGDQDVGRGRA